MKFNIITSLIALGLTSGLNLAAVAAPVNPEGVTKIATQIENVDGQTESQGNKCAIFKRC